ncbi:hypothetical protein ACUXST_001509 [Sphingomonas sp. F9_3S_D5_B_2]
MGKLDLKKTRKALFSARRDHFTAIEVPPVAYLMADGHGDPNVVPEYRRVVESLYATAYGLKFAAKANGRDFVVAPLEGLWSAPDPQSFTARRKHEWDWTMMIMVPDFVAQQDFHAAASKARQKLGALAGNLRLDTLEEGLCVQALHVGSYDDEGPLLARLHHQIMPEGGYEFAGRHHEVYLSDPRKTSAEKLKTLVRQPVRRSGPSPIRRP